MQHQKSLEEKCGHEVILEREVMAFQNVDFTWYTCLNCQYTTVYEADARSAGYRLYSTIKIDESNVLYFWLKKSFK